MWSQVPCPSFQSGKLPPHSDLALIGTFSGSFNLISKTSQPSYFAKLSCSALPLCLSWHLSSTGPGLAVRLLGEENKASNSQQQKWKQLVAQLPSFQVMLEGAAHKKQCSGILTASVSLLTAPTAAGCQMLSSSSPSTYTSPSWQPIIRTVKGKCHVKTDLNARQLVGNLSYLTMPTSPCREMSFSLRSTVLIREPELFWAAFSKRIHCSEMLPFLTNLAFVFRVSHVHSVEGALKKIKNSNHMRTSQEYLDKTLRWH